MTDNPLSGNPRKNDVRLDADGDPQVWDGEKWVPFEDVPPSFGPTAPLRDY